MKIPRLFRWPAGTNPAVTSLWKRSGDRVVPPASITQKTNQFFSEVRPMSAESLLIILLVGGIAGWLAGIIVQGTGFGLVADIALGIVGAFVGNWLLPRLGLRLGGGFVAEIIIATIGAITLLIILGLFQRSGG